MALEGMDPDDVRRRAAHLNALTSDLVEMESKFKVIFDDGSTWVGGDSKSARAQLHGQVIPALAIIRRFAEDTAQLMSQEAAQQELSSG